MFPAHPLSIRAAKLLLGALMFLQACSCALSTSGETCYSRQHRDTNVNVRKALDHQKTIMDVRTKEAERDCILACCSEELKPGMKCNMVVYKPQSEDSVENCYLFHCETEQDCPLMSAKPGTNTYDIFKGLTHPSVKVKERVPTMPITTTKQTTTTQSTTTTTTQPTTKTSTMQFSTTVTPTTATTSTIAPTELAIILLTMPVEIMPSTTTTATTKTQSTATTTKVSHTSSTTTATHPFQTPRPPPNPIRPSKKQTRPPKKPEPHGKSNAKEAEIPTLQKQTTQKTMIPTTATTSASTTTPTTTTTTTTTTTPSTTTTTTPSTTTTTTPSTTTTTAPASTTITTPTTTITTTTSTTTTERTTIVIVEMENDLKNRDSDPKAPAVVSASDKAKDSHLMWKNSLALLVVLTLIILTFVVAIVGRKAMESFDRRHYTRLELNDLHYEI